MTDDAPLDGARRHSDVVAIIINHNGAEHLGACIDTLRQQDHPVDIVVVDNASTDASKAVLERHGGDVRILWNTDNRGYAGGANDGLAVTDHPWVLLLNPDVRLAVDHVSTLLAAVADDVRLGSLQGRLLRFDGVVSDHAIRDPMRALGGAVMDSAGHAIDRARLFRNRGEGEPATSWSEPAEIFGVTGAACLHRRSMLTDVALPRPGGRPEVFDEQLFAWFEDVDIDWRARLRGWSARYVPDAVGWHERGGRRSRRTALVEELNFANRLLVLAKHDTFSTIALPLIVATTMMKAVLLGPRVLVAALRRLVAGWPAVRADRRTVRSGARVNPRAVTRRWVEPVRWRSRLPRRG